MKGKVKVIFDIETAREREVIGKDEEEFGLEHFDQCGDEYEKAWFKFSRRRYGKEEFVDELYKDKAGLTPEFSMVVCIVAIDSINKIPVRFRMVLDESDVSEEAIMRAEKEMIEEFYKWIDGLKGKVQLMGHNIKKFDMPVMNVRSVKHGIKLHGAFKMYGLKPWELDVIDTMEVWRGGLFSSTQASSLDDVCRVLGIESPKGGGDDGLDGSMVGEEFWRGKGSFDDRINRICNYCERDTVQNSKVLNKMFLLNMI